MIPLQQGAAIARKVNVRQERFSVFITYDNSHGFGVCVNYDFLDKEFYLVTDSQNTESPEDEPSNIFYTCQDGNKHWLKADIPQELLDRIFNECGKVVSDREKVQAASGSRLETPPPVQGWQYSFSG